MRAPSLRQVMVGVGWPGKKAFQFYNVFKPIFSLTLCLARQLHCGPPRRPHVVRTPGELERPLVTFDGQRGLNLDLGREIVFLYIVVVIEIYSVSTCPSLFEARHT